ncbi:MAG: hypothetical protein QMD01_00815 [Thermodesulfovibrionales bacterium]|nr:hypothetical protein [Thermodesulfovibrionales bacterium]
MKRFLAVVLGAMLVLGFAVSAFAQDGLKLSGSLTMRGWYLDTLDNNSNDGNGDDAYYDTQLRLMFDATVGKAKAVIELQNGAGGSSKWGRNTDFQAAENMNLSVKQAYIAFPVAGLNISAGHQLLSLGVKSFFDASKDGAKAILVTYPFDKKNIVGVGTIKALDTDVLASTAIAEDKDIYFGLASFDLNGHTLGLNAAAVIDNAVAKSHLYNWALTLNGKLGAGLGYTLAADIQTGKQDGANDNKGYHVRGALSYQATPELNLSAASIYFSGEESGADVKKFVTFLEDTNYATWVFGYMNRGFGATIGTGTPAPGGFWFNRLAADYKATKDLSVGLAYINIRGTYDSSVNASKEVGNEIDFTIAYNISKGLTYNVIGGFLMPGKAYENANPLRDDTAIGIRHALTLSF